jgi:hypothetical protein
MKPKTTVVWILVAAFVVVGCASPDARYVSDQDGDTAARSNQGYYAVIDSIEAERAGDGRDTIGGNGAYRIRIRFDDRTYRTVTQSSLDGLRVGDSVRIESERVRRY